ncbi:MAG: hypothetical protein KC478_14920 [Bacteriovoracaceae bacterium]|nr:hypothetical protein [Bacteriovoracaceae bacterium]
MKRILACIIALTSVSVMARTKVLFSDDCSIYKEYPSSGYHVPLNLALADKGYEITSNKEDASFVWTYDFVERSKIKTTWFSDETYSYKTMELKLLDQENQQEVRHANGRLLGTKAKKLSSNQVKYKSWHRSYSHRFIDNYENEVDAIMGALRKLPRCRLKNY